MRVNGEKTINSTQANSARLLSLYLVALAVSVGFALLTAQQAHRRALTRPEAAAPSRNIQQCADEITQALFPDSSPATLVWSSLSARIPEGGIVWAVDIYLGANQAGRLAFNGTGRLRQYSCRMTQNGSPLRRPEDAFLIARAKLRCLQKSDWYDCHLSEEKPLRKSGQTEGSWYIRGQKPGKRILMTLDARTGALLFFSETVFRPQSNL